MCEAGQFVDAALEGEVGADEHVGLGERRDRGDSGVDQRDVDALAGVPGRPQVVGTDLVDDLGELWAAAGPGATEYLSSVFSSAWAFVVGALVGVFLLYFGLRDWHSLSNWVAGHMGVPHEVGRDIVADATHAILTRDARQCTGNFFIDDDVLREEGVSDFERYRAAIERLGIRK